MQFLLKWPNHANAVAAGLLKLFKENFKTDFELSINGSYIKAHHLILAMFCSRVKSEDKSTLILGEHSFISAEDVHQLLAFIYTGEIDVDESRLISLRELCHLMGFQDLFNIITTFLTGRKPAAQSPTRSSKRTRHAIRSTSTNEIEKTKVNINAENEKIGKESHSKHETQSEENSNDEVLEPTDSNVEERKHELHSDSNGEGEQAAAEPRLSAESIAESETTKPKYACRLCSYTNNFKNNRYIALHMISRHRVDLDGKPVLKNWQCPQCPKKFYANEFLRKHISTAHWEKRFVCEHCGVKFRYQNGLKVHLRGKHSEIKPYICEMCGMQFSFSNNLRAHYDTHVPNIVKCEVCGDSVTKGCLQKHMKNKHSTGPKTHQCSFCSFGTWNNWNLKTHLKNVHKVTIDAQVNETFYEN